MFVCIFCVIKLLDGFGVLIKCISVDSTATEISVDVLFSQNELKFNRQGECSPEMDCLGLH